MVVWNRTASGGWSSSSTGQSSSSLGYGSSSSSSSSSRSSGASSAPSASGASQAVGGTSSQSSAVASTSKSYTYTKSDGSKGTTTDYRHSDAAKAANAANKSSSSSTSSGSSSGSKSSGSSSSSAPVVTTATVNIPQSIVDSGGVNGKTVSVGSSGSSSSNSSSGGNKYAGTVSISGGNGISDKINTGGNSADSAPVVTTATVNIPQSIVDSGGVNGKTVTIGSSGNSNNNPESSSGNVPYAWQAPSDAEISAAINSGDISKEQPNPTKQPEIVIKTPYISNEVANAVKEANASGKGITIMSGEQAEYNEMHPIKTPGYATITGNAQMHLDSQNKQMEQIAAGNYFGAYKEGVGINKIQEIIDTSQIGTINPAHKSVTLTETLRTDPLIGNMFTAVQTSLFNAEGKFDPLPLVGNRNDVDAAYTKRVQEYEVKEGGNTGRVEQAMGGALEIATLPLNFVGGVGTGAAIGTASKGLAKLTGTKVGQTITNAVTKPWISNEVVINSAFKVSNVVSDTTNKVVATYDKLPAPIRRELYQFGSNTLSAKGLSTFGVSALAGVTGMDTMSAGIVKKTADGVFRTAALAKGGSINNAYNLYSRPIISEANFKALSNGIKTGAVKIINVEHVAETKFPKAYSAATMLKNAFSTPGAAVMNTLQIAYLGDAGYRIATSDDKLKTAAQVAVEIPVGFLGAKYGMQAIDKASSYLATRGRQFIPIEKIGYAEGIPLGKGMTDKTLEASFELNTPIPKPYRFGRTEKQNQPTPKQAKITPSNKYDPDTGINYEVAFPNQVWHATPQGERLGSKIIVGDSTSELPGIYTSEVGVGYYLHLEQKNNIKPALLIQKSNPSYTPKFATFRVAGIESIPVKGRVSQAQYLRDRANPVKAYAPNMKEEYEALLPPGANFVRTGKGYYTVINGNRVPIDEYAPNLDASIEYMQLRAMDAKYNLNLSTSKKISATELYANKNLRNGVDKSKFRVYKPSKAYSSYGKASGKQLPLGGTSYAGSKAIRSLSKIGSSGNYAITSVGAFSDFTISSFGKPTSSGKSTGGSSTSRPKTPSTPNVPSMPNVPSISIPTGTNKPIIPSILSPGKSGRKETPLKRKREDKRGIDIDYYSAARRGRIDHLSIVDPLEFLGKGSLTNRKRADMTLYKQKLYLVDNEISLTKPEGRRRK